MTSYFIGVDVGTGSVRAALVTEKGKILNCYVKSTQTWNIQPDFYEQSTDNIWEAVVTCVKKVIKGQDAKQIKGIGFDATCSLACFDKDGKPLTVSPSGNNQQNVILWLDHRAMKETEFINSLNHPVLKYVGGKIFPEMETPKLMWLKRYLKDTWRNAGYFFDLPDFLTWRATGVDSRSSCSLVCKWTYEMNVEGVEAWNKSYFEQIGLDDLAEDNWKKIGSTVQYPGQPVGKGLSKLAAEELGLLPGTPVGTSMIDAHAGGLGLIGCKADCIDPDFETRVGLICGTSTCHMAVSKEATFTPGVWGPYKNAMIPGMWLNEGGQSTTGKLVDHVIDTHPASLEIKKKLGNMHIIEYLNNVLYDLAKKENLSNPAFLTKDFHVYPDFHGNRLLSDPTLKGMVTGLTLNFDEESLALLYLATVQALSYGTRQILDRLKESGYSNLKSTLICGGLSKNPIFTAAQANVCNLPVICPDEIESVLLGSAILGAVAANHFDTLEHAIQTMGGEGKAVFPDPTTIDFHNRKYEVFLQMYEDQVKYRKIMGVL
ncbi:FGGY carbohydrate kinase domain-containing protein [Anthonomus grandis grandis]|uniref:FGGY carbohydrate kinase domain-containing protein n=1 Tax=Anthonomus grandis grandis TaxID=2921223 RepID=UPI002165FFC4|nr:FGGY carbohydrate kinase domain-containing protein [Anthonomus grandis grandis]